MSNSTKRNSFYFFCIIILVALNNNCYEYLSNHSVKAAQTLFYRGVFTLIASSVYGYLKGEKLFPQNISAQSVRFITTGGSLLLILESYPYLSAGTVSMLQRLDIPFLIFFSIAQKQHKKLFQIVLSVLTVLAILVITINPEYFDDDYEGFLFVFGGVSMTAIGYLTMHKGSTKESPPALINISAISSIIFGAGIISFNHQSWLISTHCYFIILLSAIFNVMLFYITIQLYKVYAPERALLPFVWAIFSTSILEMIIEKEVYHLHDIIIKVILTLLISLICLGGKRQTIKVT